MINDLIERSRKWIELWAQVQGAQSIQTRLVSELTDALAAQAVEIERLTNERDALAARVAELGAAQRPFASFERALAALQPKAPAPAGEGESQ